MSARQLRLFPHARPLLERLGDEFFRSIPRVAGVYTMRGPQEQILYIGQSKNLRIRLATNKNARPGELPRRIIRLVHQTQTIEWQECASAQEAQTLESSLIRKHRPRFNVAQTLPVTWYYLGVKVESRNRWALRLTFRPDSEPDERLHGAFPGRMMGKRYFQALVRLVWASIFRPASIYELPVPFNRRIYRWNFEAWTKSLGIASCAVEPDLVGDFLSGANAELVEQMEEWFPEADEHSTDLMAQLCRQDLDLLREFFLRGPARLHAFRRRDDHGKWSVVGPEQWEPDEDPLPSWLMRDGQSTPRDQYELPGIFDDTK